MLQYIRNSKTFDFLLPGQFLKITLSSLSLHLSIFFLYLHFFYCFLISVIEFSYGLGKILIICSAYSCLVKQSAKMVIKTKSEKKWWNKSVKKLANFGRVNATVTNFIRTAVKFSLILNFNSVQILKILINIFKHHFK